MRPAFITMMWSDKRHGLGLVVGDEDAGDTEPGLHVAQLEPHLLPQARVQIRQRLVQQQHLGVRHEGPRERYPLLLAPRQHGRRTRVQPSQPDRV